MKTSLYLTLSAVLFATSQPSLLPAQNISPAAGPTLSLNYDEQMADGFVMANGKVYTVHRGVATPLDHDMTLRVTPTGIIGFDNQSRRITSNAMITLGGAVVDAPKDLVFVSPPELPADQRLQSAGVYSQVPSILAPANNGPHFVIAKKHKAVKSTASTTTTTTTTKRSPAAERSGLPAFSDELIPLPKRNLNEDATLRPTIDAGNTMLNMTTAAPAPAPETSALPNVPSISDELNFGVDTGNYLDKRGPISPPLRLPQNHAPLPPQIVPPIKESPVIPVLPTTSR